MARDLRSVRLICAACLGQAVGKCVCGRPFCPEHADHTCWTINKGHLPGGELTANDWG